MAWLSSTTRMRAIITSRVPPHPFVPAWPASANDGQQHGKRRARVHFSPSVRGSDKCQSAREESAGDGPATREFGPKSDAIFDETLTLAHCLWSTQILSTTSPVTCTKYVARCAQLVCGSVRLRAPTHICHSASLYSSPPQPVILRPRAALKGLRVTRG